MIQNQGCPFNKEWEINDDLKIVEFRDLMVKFGLLSWIYCFNDKLGEI